jgi:secreted trypsin-like serine protease
VQRDRVLPVLMLSLLCLAAAMLLPGAQAIVIRHDTGYSRHAASEAQFPAVFWLEQRSQRKVCVATLIDPRWALTAAHCVEETGLQRHIASQGEYVVQIAGKLQGIDHVEMHPDYQFRDHPQFAAREVDMALLRLAEPMALPRPVPLYRDSDEQDREVTLLGWGYFGLGTTGIEHDDGRFRLARNIVSVAAQRLRLNFDDPRMPGNAAVELEGIPGLGDSGGPALLQTPQGWQLAGIAVGEVASRAATPQAAGLPPAQGLYGAVGIYERVSAHLAWIESVLLTTAAAVSD